MPTCYQCGRHIPSGEGHRVKVRTGSSWGLSFPINGRGRSTRGSGRRYYGLRTLCHSCANPIIGTIVSCIVVTVVLQLLAGLLPGTWLEPIIHGANIVLVGLMLLSVHPILLFIGVVIGFAVYMSDPLSDGAAKPTKETRRYFDPETGASKRLGE